MRYTLFNFEFLQTLLSVVHQLGKTFLSLIQLLHTSIKSRDIKMWKV